ncbi:relaxase/mobilization nuclease domain-containing protein [Paenibacillus sp. KQZ6P-2]|uniref:Relaxase/mobilization nuclease domain-containing protein n=1 Tax=Paenibacillus mangrovi TaxID=2931978 RepID=A0A9X2B0F4_9BACL|nr:relaxase/mobilization nuclease domain-containing protein [Paenibacillus mangrovi]
MPYVKQITIRQTLNRSLRYIVNEKKTEYGCFVSGVNCATNDKLAYKQMVNNKNRYGKEDGTQGFHFIQSFKPNEISDPYKAHEIGLKWAAKMFGNKYQYIISTHLDKGHLHNHIIINSVSLGGKKFNACKSSLQEARRLSDEVAKEYDLGIIPVNKDTESKSYKEWKEEKNGLSWKATIKNDIDSTLHSASSFEDFVAKMQANGYVMKQGNVKYMTFKHPNMERSVRGKTLGVEYTEERIRERIKFKDFNLNQSKRLYNNRFTRKTYKEQRAQTARRYYFKRGGLAVNFMLTITLVRTMMNREKELNGNTRKRNFGYDLQINTLTDQLKFITDKQLNSRDDLKRGKSEIENKLNEIDSVQKEAVKINENLNFAITSIETYLKYKKIHEEYEGTTFRKSGIKRKFNVELETFDKAKKQLLKMGVQVDQYESLLVKQKSYENQIEKLYARAESLGSELKMFNEIEKTLSDRSVNYRKAKSKDRNMDR